MQTLDGVAQDSGFGWRGAVARLLATSRRVCPEAFPIKAATTRPATGQ
jgi:hypothetical protein